MQQLADEVIGYGTHWVAVRMSLSGPSALFRYRATVGWIVGIKCRRLSRREIIDIASGTRASL